MTTRLEFCSHYTANKVVTHKDYKMYTNSSYASKLPFSSLTRLDTIHKAIVNGHKYDVNPSNSWKEQLWSITCMAPGKSMPQHAVARRLIVA